jgi:hypothetical protein
VDLRSRLPPAGRLVRTDRGYLFGTINLVDRTVRSTSAAGGLALTLPDAPTPSRAEISTASSRLLPPGLVVSDTPSRAMAYVLDSIAFTVINRAGNRWAASCLAIFLIFALLEGLLAVWVITNPMYMPRDFWDTYLRWLWPS